MLCPFSYTLYSMLSTGSTKGYSRKKYLGGEDGRQYIFLWVVGAESFQIIWVVVGAESFQIIWVIGVRPNLITWQIPAILDDIK